MAQCCPAIRADPAGEGATVPASRDASVTLACPRKDRSVLFLDEKMPVLVQFEQGHKSPSESQSQVVPVLHHLGLFNTPKEPAFGASRCVTDHLYAPHRLLRLDSRRVMALGNAHRLMSGPRKLIRPLDAQGCGAYIPSWKWVLSFPRYTRR
jgi:hypothetical protein